MLSSNHVLPTSGFSKLLFNEFFPPIKDALWSWVLTVVFLNQSVQLLSCVWLSATPMDCSIPDFPVHHQLLELAQMHVPWVGDTSNHFILCWSLLLLASIFLSIRVFSNESVLWIRWPKYWSFSFSISSSNEYSGLISFRMDWLDLLAVQETLESSPTQQFKNINSSILSFLYSPTLRSTHDYWENHSFDYMDFCGQNDASAIEYAV